MAGGNYGGNSTPTTPIEGDNLYAGRLTTYSGYTCTAYVGAAATTFTYNGMVINSTTSYIQTIIKPSLLGSDPGATVTFFCYDCSCDGPMNGIIDAGATADGFYSGNTAWMQPTIIGGGGLNS